MKEVVNNFVDTEFRYLCVSEHSTIIQAMRCIETGREKICFVVDNHLHLLRVISDGDIRRALLNGRKLSDKVKNIHKENLCMTILMRGKQEKL
mgnify:CR=1 FL=1